MDSTISEYLKDIVEKLLVLFKGLSFQNPVVFLAILILAVYAANLLNKNYEMIITFIENNLINRPKENKILYFIIQHILKPVGILLVFIWGALNISSIMFCLFLIVVMTFIEFKSLVDAIEILDSIKILIYLTFGVVVCLLAFFIEVVRNIRTSRRYDLIYFSFFLSLISILSSFDKNYCYTVYIKPSLSINLNIIVGIIFSIEGILIMYAERIMDFYYEHIPCLKLNGRRDNKPSIN